MCVDMFMGMVSACVPPWRSVSVKLPVSMSRAVPGPIVVSWMPAGIDMCIDMYACMCRDMCIDICIDMRRET